MRRFTAVAALLAISCGLAANSRAATPRGGFVQCSDEYTYVSDGDSDDREDFAAEGNSEPRQQFGGQREYGSLYGDYAPRYQYQQPYGYGQCDDCDDCQRDCWRPHDCDILYSLLHCFCPCSPWEFGYEQTILKPYFSQAFGVPQNILNDSMLVFEPPLADFDSVGAPRFWLTYMDCDGHGIRGRYWGFDQGANRATFFNFPQLGLNTVTTGDMDFQTFDLEYLQRRCNCNWQFTVSGGLRIARIDQGSHVRINNGITIDAFDHRHNFDGAGPTIAAELLHPIGCTEFSIFGNGRCSLLFGSLDSRTEILDLIGQPVRYSQSTDSPISVFELQLGGQWSRCLEGGANLIVRLAMEGQFWNDAGNLYSTGSDVGFFGAAIAVGITR